MLGSILCKRSPRSSPCPSQHTSTPAHQHTSTPAHHSNNFLISDTVFERFRNVLLARLSLSFPDSPQCKALTGRCPTLADLKIPLQGSGSTSPERGALPQARRCWRNALLPQLLAAPLVAGSLFLLPATIAEAQQRSQTSNQTSLPTWVQLLIEPNGVLAALGLGSPIGLSVAWAIRGMAKSHNSLNTIKGVLDQQSNKITENHNSLNIIKGVLDQQSNEITRSHDSLNTIKGVLDQQSNEITRSHDSLNTIKGVLDQQSNKITENHNSLNTIKGVLDQQSNEITRSHDSLNTIKGVLDQQSNEITRSHDSLNTIKGALDQQSNKITENHNSLNTIKGVLDQQSNEVTRSHDSLNTIKGALDQQSNEITRSFDTIKLEIENVKDLVG